ncbi:UDP-N-acetyl-alpha-D-muramoyl-L-alanyl-L-glutamate epimerase [Montanilutibacter psychrotolerans]|uniref:UDP-N-acetyl-alpha-D-muramoyl-L-alanyl-L-glutamate epimerase n=1 Tax=Montanilutibacter psychrotolerans TaxID=1327343 RepID=A0A3M8T4H9_9GAMM|nr:UDP-N-acetyl-alpha-D-muramoyl-L-alanyl-L-glutamate epimerase [Lysobacter psychrotolerans]RNF86110.1 endonuclease domain-containing protein [Lysobacter psychrotolerans]
MTEWKFQRDAIATFRFVRCGFDAATGVAHLVYAFDDGPELVETVTVPGAPFTLDADRAVAVERALRLLHLVTGVSYYKAAVPPRIVIDSYAIDADTAALLETIYVNGLGEFAYRNGLNLHGRIRFPHDAPDDTVAPALGLREHALVAIGGGKDSLVSIESLRALGVEQTVTWIGGSQLIRACAERTGLDTLNVGRALAPQLFDYNREGAWNGHIPVTAVNSAILVLAAVLGGVDQVVFSNERSASYGSLIEGTGEVNHQWSKGWAFESAFGDYVHKHVAADLHYYSLLRPLSELAVARQFARIDRYDAHFSSCNRNFHILGERPVNRWCGVCPKCHFVFLALAPFMPKPRLVGIFGRNLLDDAAQTAGFDALLEFQDHKPFECVGEGRESRAAMAALAARPEWREDVLVERFVAEIQPQLDAAELAVDALLVLDDEQRIPASLWERLRAHLSA